MSFADLERPADLPAGPDGAMVNRLMHLMWQSRADLRLAFDLATPAGRRGLIAWYWGRTGRLHRAPPSRVSRGVKTLRRLGRRALRSMPDECASFVRAGRLHLAALYARLGAGWSGRAGRSPMRSGFTRFPRGFNLVGHVSSQLGLGQNLRMIGAALMEGGVPCTVVEFSVGVAAPACDTAEIPAITMGDPHAVNVLFMSPDMLPAAIEYLGPDFFRGRINVLYAFWELEVWPRAWLEWLDLFDEIWVPTAFVERSLSGCARCPVVRVPPCVTLPEVDGALNAMPPEAMPGTRFLSIVDANSYLDRKNPLGLVLAFKRAFPLSRYDVRLVLKVINASTEDPHWRRVLDAIDADPRIRVVEGVVPRHAIAALYRESDCFVSLHRSEGFGLCIAEAMLSGIPVITTAYSGNLDFTNDDCAYMVRSRPVSVPPHSYPHWEHQSWADPDLEQAAMFMRAVADDPAAASALGRAGQAHVMTQFAPRELAGRFDLALRRLGVVPPE